MPNIDDSLKQLLKEPVKSIKCQKDPLTVKFDDILIESEPEKQVIWNRAGDKYFAQLLDDCLNKVKPNSEKSIKDLSEKDCAQWLSETDFDVNKDKP